MCLARIETKLDHFATKADLAGMQAELIKWMIGLAVGLGATAITVMTFVLNNAVPKAPTVAAAQPPIVIYAPPAPTTGQAPAAVTPERRSQ